MATLATPIALAQALLDDVEVSVFTEAVLLPVLNSAWRELQTELAQNGVKSQVVTVSNLAAAANATVITTPPSDMILPYEMWERKNGTTDEFVPVQLVDDIPDEDLTEELRWWKWENGAVGFLGATVARDIKLQYEKAQADFTAAANTIPIPYAEDFLAWTAAALMARSRGQRDLYRDYREESRLKLDNLLRLHVRGNQRLPRRQRAYGAPTRNYN